MKFRLLLAILSISNLLAQESGTVGFNGETRNTGPDDLNYRAASVRATNVTVVSAVPGQIAVIDSANQVQSTNAAGARSLIGAAPSSHGHSISDVTGLQGTLDGKAPTSHSHTIGDTTGLQGALDSKAAASHTHGDADLTSIDWNKILNRPSGLDDGDDVGEAGSGEANTASSLGAGWKLTYDKSGVDLRFNTFTNSTGITISSNANMYVFGIDPAVVATQSDLSTGLSGKANTSHTHGIADTSGLQGALDGKAAASHGHAISEVTGLQGALDGKAPTSHSHAIGDTTGLQGALDGKAAASHTHAKADLPAATHEAVFILTIEDVADGMNYAIGYVGRAFTISEIRAVHVGSGLSAPSIQLTVQHGTDRTSGTAVVEVTLE